jgi:hypothetical protein
MCVNQEVTPIVDNVARLEVSNLNTPLTLVAVPFSTRDVFLEATVFAQIVFLSEAEEIFLYFVGACVDGRPVGIGLERPGVGVSCNIAGATIANEKGNDKSVDGW